MSGLSQLATGLTLFFAVFLLLLLAQVFYVLWYRRRFRRRNATVEEASGEPYTTTTTTTNPFTSKELMFLFCWNNNQSRIEPASAPTAPSMDDQEDPSSEPENPLKWRVLYGPSRLLFTINEEEKEDLESEKSSSTNRKTNPDKKGVSLIQYFERSREELTAETSNSVAIDVERETTPFSTPCASPPYYTPSPSPTRDVLGG